MKQAKLAASLATPRISVANPPTREHNLMVATGEHSVPERLLFGKAWIDHSGLTFARNDMFEVHAYLQIGKISHVFPMKSVPTLIDGRSTPRFAEMLGLVPEALNYVSSLTVGQAFPPPMRTRKVPDAPQRRFEEALATSRMLAAKGEAGQERALFLDVLHPAGDGFDREALERRLVGVPPEQARFVLSEIQSLRAAIMTHAGISQAIAFGTSWDRVREQVDDLHKDLGGQLRWFSSMFSYSVGFLREIVSIPNEILAAQSDQAHVELRAALGDGDLAKISERQFAIWRECRRVEAFFGHLVSIWDVMDFSTAPRMHIESLVRSTVCRLQSFQ